MRNLISIFLFISIVSCNSEDAKKPRHFSKVEIETLLQDSLLNIRALEIDNQGNFGFATSKGEIGGKSYEWDNYPSNDLTEQAKSTKQIKHDSIIPNFRALAVTNNAGFVLSVGTPALLYKTTDSLKLVYKESHEKSFYDSMAFWNDQEGIAIGDPTNDCLSIIITRDAGETWTKLSCENLPKAIEGEAAFAASDTNIATVGEHTWVATGGMASRILYSSDKGKTWTVYNTPIIQGKKTTGIYSIDFYDAKLGFAIGGDYTQPNDTLKNKIRTTDGGQTWEVIANAKGPGYRSCVQFVPNSEGKELVATGFNGIDYSNDFGISWKHLSDEGFYTLRFLNDSIAYAAGNGRLSKLTFKE
ncbi:MAG: oxidoreductase [Winogradskyella sp.]|uniref:WD40/YVTN/BNR-like repeat-containing protein n=1 Tax=Winogradskyella sp. TaxID=1883156 RepID=UPI0017DECD74|nr:oxidoreductase [Winogradskyella sp.]